MKYINKQTSENSDTKCGVTGKQMANKRSPNSRSLPWKITSRIWQA